MKEEILLESGTNEVEMLTFSINNLTYGINVSKVQGIIQYKDNMITEYPHRDDRVLGLIFVQEKSIPLLDLRTVLNLPPLTEEIERKVVIILEFNRIQTAIFVDRVEKIYRVTWDQFIPLSQPEKQTLGTIKINERRIVIVDFEEIVSSIFPESNISDVAAKSQINKNESRTKFKIIHIDDSLMIKKIIGSSLNKAGYNLTKDFSNGKECFDYLHALKINEPEELKKIDLFIIDIEMPIMDGLTLCKKIREEIRLVRTPIIMFSSLIDTQMKEKCKEVGATTQVSKPELDELVKIMDEALKITNK